MRDAVGHVQKDFHEYAEPLRVFIERERATPISSNDPRGDESGAIREDLAALECVSCDGPPSDPSLGGP